jgi:hypothetical protein
VVAAQGAAARIAVLDHVALAIAAPHAQRALPVAQAGSEHERSNGHLPSLLRPQLAACPVVRPDREILEPLRTVGGKAAQE